MKPKRKIIGFDAIIPNLDGDGIAESVKVKIPVKWDEEIKGWLMTPKGHKIIEDTLARHMGLLRPEQFKELRERIGYSQERMGRLFQVGAKSWTRWETGKQRPSRSINLLIKAVYQGELSVKYLMRLSDCL